MKEVLTLVAATAVGVTIGVVLANFISKKLGV